MSFGWEEGGGGAGGSVEDGHRILKTGNISMYLKAIRHSMDTPFIPKHQITAFEALVYMSTPLCFMELRSEVTDVGRESTSLAPS